MFRLVYFLVGLLPATVFCATLTQQPKPNEYSIGMKTLVLFNQAEDQTVARLVLDGYGTLYDIRNTIPDDLTVGKPKYYAIVVSDPNVNKGNFTALRDYAERYNVRIAFLKSPLNLSGISVSPEKKKYQNVVFGADDESLKIADVVNSDGYWNANYTAQVAQPIQVTDTQKVTPFMRYTDNTYRESEGPVAAFIYTFPSGRQEMHFTFSAAANELCSGCPGVYKDQPNFIQTGDYTYLSLALGHVWFQWITRSIYFGERRIHAHVQVDDWYLASSVYGEPKKLFRINGTDVGLTVEFVKSLPQKLNLTRGSYIRYEPAFNGAGNTGFLLEQGRPLFYPERLGVGLNDATNKHIADFHWVSHTWSHQQLDWLNADQCNQMKNKCHVSPERVHAELKANRMIAAGLYVNATELSPTGLDMEAPTPQGQMFYGKPDLAKQFFSYSCLVTPEISGLYPKNYNMKDWNGKGGLPVPGNTVLMRALWDNGIRAVVGDNSRPELVSKVSFHHAVITTVEEYGVAGIVIVPRIAVNIAYNAHNEEQLLNWYNGVGACNFSVGIKCREKEEKKNYTFEEALHRQARLVPGTWLALRADPFMFHQANLHHFRRADGSVTSLLTYWTEHAIRYFTRYITGMPITSPKMDVTAERYRQRTIRDMADITASMNIRDGQVTSISLSSAKECVAFLTVGDQEIYQPTMGGGSISMEVSGKDTTYHIPSKGSNVITPVLLRPSNKKIASVIVRPTEKRIVPGDSRVNFANRDGVNSLTRLWMTLLSMATIFVVYG